MKAKLSLILLFLPALCVGQTYTYSTLASFRGASKQGPVQPRGSLIIDGTGNLYGTSTYGGADNLGTDYKVSPKGVVTVLYSFTGGGDGAYPVGSLTRDKVGNLYGISYTPSTGQSVVYKLSPTGKLTVLYTFPVGTYLGLAVTLDSAGNLYGTTTTTPDSYGDIFKLTPSGALSTLYTFCTLSDCADGYYPQGGVIIDKAGNLYGTTVLGGTGDGTIFKLTSDGIYTVLHSFLGFADGQDSFNKLTQDKTGNLYGATLGGITDNNGLIFEVTTSGMYFVLYSFCPQQGCADGSTPDGGVTLDSDGNIYGVTELGGKGYGVMYKVTTAGTESVLWDFGSAGTERQPVMDASGNLYGTTLDGPNINGTVYKLAKHK